MKLNNDYLNAARAMLQQADTDLAHSRYWDAREQTEAAIKELEKLVTRINELTEAHRRDSAIRCVRVETK